MKHYFTSVFLFLFLLSYHTSTVAQYIEGQTYFGENDYIEYKAGNLPIVISAPHGGSLEPSEIPNRSCSGCVYVRDTNTEDLSRKMYDAIFELFGCYPHLIINRLHRRKLDANRDIEDAADGHPLGEQAWEEFHHFINAAKADISAKYGKGLYLDIHGHGHEIQRLELGYRLSKSELQLPNSILNEANYIDDSSIRHLANNNLQQHTLSELLRGVNSFGELYEQNTYPSVPSQNDPYPLDEDAYFRGGYNTEIHGSKLGGTIDGIQIECNMEGVRDNNGNRAEFAAATALVLKQYLEKHYFGANFWMSNCGLTTSIEENPAANSPLVHIFPNPVKEFLNIRIEGNIQGKVSIEVVNELGQILYFHKHIIEGNSLRLSSDNFTNGLYFLKIDSADFVRFEKFFVFKK